uniref:Uncharacterized protein n=1 Tax=Anguilla anguilla TaxID=7936 RepID=A0A0E9Q306_ANGAN
MSSLVQRTAVLSKKVTPNSLGQFLILKLLASGEEPGNQGDRSTGVWNSDEHTADDAFRGRQPNQWHKYLRILSNLLL